MLFRSTAAGLSEHIHSVAALALGNDDWLVAAERERAIARFGIASRYLSPRKFSLGSAHNSRSSRTVLLVWSLPVGMAMPNTKIDRHTSYSTAPGTVPTRPCSSGFNIRRVSSRPNEAPRARITIVKDRPGEGRQCAALQEYNTRRRRVGSRSTRRMAEWEMWRYGAIWSM